jgi:hypothetical protein
MSDKGYYIWLDAIAEDEEIPAWKSLDIVIRKWAVLSLHEKDLEAYQNRKIIYQD